MGLLSSIGWERTLEYGRRMERRILRGRKVLRICVLKLSACAACFPALCHGRSSAKSSRDPKQNRPGVVYEKKVFTRTWRSFQRIAQTSFKLSSEREADYAQNAGISIHSRR